MATVNRHSARSRFLFGAILSLGGCGDSVYDQNYRGEPVYTQSRTIIWNAEGPPDATDLRFSLFFNPGLPGAVDVDNWIELGASITPIPQLPTYISFNIFDLPSPEMLAHGADGTPLGYGTASQLAYRDSNHDGRRSLDEPFLGPIQSSQYLYLPEPTPASRLPTNVDLPAGFHRIFTPQICGQAPPGPMTAGDCGVPLGGKCATDKDCNGGYCLTQSKQPWRAGYCTVQEPPKNGCRPAASVYWPKPKVTTIPQGVIGYYLRPCSQDADCLRPTDTNQRLYSCDLGLGACVPADSLVTNIGLPSDFEPFCGSGNFVPKP